MRTNISGGVTRHLNVTAIDAVCFKKFLFSIEHLISENSSTQITRNKYSMHGMKRKNLCKK